MLWYIVFIKIFSKWVVLCMHYQLCYCFNNWPYDILYFKFVSFLLKNLAWEQFWINLNLQVKTKLVSNITFNLLCCNMKSSLKDTCQHKYCIGTSYKWGQSTSSKTWKVKVEPNAKEKGGFIITPVSLFCHLCPIREVFPHFQSSTESERKFLHQWWNPGVSLGSLELASLLEDFPCFPVLVTTQSLIFFGFSVMTVSGNSRNIRGWAEES